MPSEKCAVGWGSDDDEMRMITASFVRAIERFAGDLCLHFFPLFQQVVALRKTCNQLHVKSSVKRCRIVKDRIRLWKQGVRDLVMELCCALHNFRVRLTPWQPMV